jgi:hypothetical protein
LNPAARDFIRLGGTFPRPTKKETRMRLKETNFSGCRFEIQHCFSGYRRADTVMVNWDIAVSAHAVFTTLLLTRCRQQTFSKLIIPNQMPPAI